MRYHAVARVFRSAFRNSVLRRISIAYFCFRSADSGIWIALLVYAFRYGGATSSMVIALVQIVPGIAFALFLAALADYVRPSRLLCSSYVVLTVSISVIALAMALHAPFAVVCVLASIASLTTNSAKPSHATLLPGIVRTPDELTAANVIGGWADGGSNLVGPGLAGLTYAVGGASLALAVMAALTFVSAAMVARVKGPRAAIALDTGLRDAAGSHPLRGPSEMWTTLCLVTTSVTTRFRRSIGQSRRMGDLLVLHTFYYVVVGALDLLCVVLALKYLRMGPGGPGLLNSAMGAGGLGAGVVTILLVGWRRLVRVLAVSIGVALAALGLIGAWRSVDLTIALIILVGFGGLLYDVTSQTLMQRVAPPDSIAGSFMLREALANVGLAVGVIVVRVVIALFGLKVALLAPAVLGTIVIGALWHRLRKLDDATVVPQVEIQLLRSLALFAALPIQIIEGLARRLTLRLVAQGVSVITAGEPGDSYYCVADGELSVTRNGLVVNHLSRGDGFGELALLRDVPRQATVTAVSDAVLYRLDKPSFLEMISSSPTAALMAENVIAEYGGGS